MGVRMIANLVAFSEHPLSDSRKGLDLLANHEILSSHAVLTEKVEDPFRIFRWTIIESQGNGTCVGASMPVAWSEPLRTHSVRGVIAGCTTGNSQHPAPNQRPCDVRQHDQTNAASVNSSVRLL